MKICFALLLFLSHIVSVCAASLPDPVRFSLTIERGDLALAKDWLDSGLAPDFEGQLIGTGVMIGAWEGNIPMMELFVSRGADVNKVNALGEQALLHAAWKGHLNAVRWLVERGASLNRQGKQWAALHYAVFAGHAEVVDFLLQRGADINALSSNGSTPLMMAAREGQEAIAKVLLTAGARPDIINEHGEDALRWAMRNNNLKIAREIAGTERFAAVIAQPAANSTPNIRSQPVPDRADSLMAQARRMEAAGRQDEARKLYQAAIASIRQADAIAKKAATAARAVTGMTITARRGQPEEQSAALSYATPAIEVENPAGNAAAASKVGAGDTASNAPSGSSGVADDWLRRAKELESSGRRKDALQAYRQAADALRKGKQAASGPPAPP